MQIEKATTAFSILNTTQPLRGLGFSLSTGLEPASPGGSMGVKGPIPKRSDERVRRNVEDVPVETITAIGPVEIPELGIPKPHPLIVDLYESMKNSAQSQYYEPSDWALARVTFHFLNKQLRSTKPSAQMLASLFSQMTSLLLTEGDRRRVRIEIERNQNQPDNNVVQVADLFRERFAKG